jgi:hypothetical protein
MSENLGSLAMSRYERRDYLLQRSPDRSIP